MESLSLFLGSIFGKWRYVARKTESHSNEPKIVKIAKNAGVIERIFILSSFVM